MKTEILSWTDGIFDSLILDTAADAEEAVFLLARNKTDFVWNILRGFEGIPATLPQTSAILDGYSVDGLRIGDLLKIRRYGEGVDMLCSMVRAGEFSVTERAACTLHGIIARDEIRDEQRGRFRTANTALRHVSFTPPSPVSLDGLWKENLFAEVSNPLERAAAVFFSLSRTQFFRDANKRTAMLLMNGILASSGVKPFFIPEAREGRFSMLLSEFYETGNADNAMAFFGNLACREEPEGPAPE